MIHCNLQDIGEGVNAKNEKWRTRARIARTREGEWFVHPTPPLFPLHPSTHLHRLAHRLLAARLAKICPTSNGRKTIRHDIFFSKK